MRLICAACMHTSTIELEITRRYYMLGRTVVSNASCNECDVVFLVGEGDARGNGGYSHLWPQSKLS